MADSIRRILVRRDTLDNWTGVVPQNGEPIGIITDDPRVTTYKIGDGVTSADQLPALSKGDAGARGPQGLPGASAQPTDAAVAGLVGTDGTSASQQAVDGRVAAGTADLRALRGPAPTTATNLPNRYNPGLFAFNMKPTNTRRWRAALDAASAGTGYCRIACEGDSTTHGDYASSFATSYPTVLANLLTKGGVPSGGSGTVITRDPDSRWTYTGSWSNFTYTTPFKQSAAAGATAKFTSVTAGTISDVVVLAVGSSTFTISIDGSAATSYSTVDERGTGNTVVKTFTTTGLPNNTHVVTVTVVSGTVFLVGAEVRSATSGLRVGNYGMNGSKTDDHVRNNDPFNDMNVVAAWSPHLVILDLTINDARNNIPVATHKANLQTIITRQRAQSDVILMTASPISTKTFDAWTQSIYELAVSNDLPLIDITQAFGGTWAAADDAGWMSRQPTDPTQLHPNDAGYGRKAEAVAAAMLTAVDSPFLV